MIIDVELTDKILSIGDSVNDLFFLEKTQLLGYTSKQSKLIKWNDVVNNFIKLIESNCSDDVFRLFSYRFENFLKANANKQNSCFNSTEEPNLYTPSLFEEIFFFPSNIDECFKNQNSLLRDLWYKHLVTLFPAQHRNCISNMLFPKESSDNLTSNIVIPTCINELNIISSHNDVVKSSLKRKSDSFDYDSEYSHDGFREKILRGATCSLGNYANDEENYDPNSEEFQNIMYSDYSCFDHYVDGNDYLNE